MIFSHPWPSYSPWVDKLERVLFYPVIYVILRHQKQKYCLSKKYGYFWALRPWWRCAHIQVWATHTLMAEWILFKVVHFKWNAWYIAPETKEIIRRLLISFPLEIPPSQQRGQPNSQRTYFIHQTYTIIYSFTLLELSAMIWMPLSSVSKK